MDDNYGLSRVIEPVGSVPVIAWKLDNSRDIRPGEARVALEKLLIEKSAFQQICNQCSYDESKMKAQIMDIVHKRGKFHNPFTDSAGVAFGTIEEMGVVFQREHPDLRIGDKYLCNETMTALPMYLDHIKSIDFNYNQLDVEGYGIIFGSTSSYIFESYFDVRYVLMANEEAGGLQRTAALAKENSTVAIIGKDVSTAMLYCLAAKMSGTNCRLIVILDEEHMLGISEEALEDVFHEAADKLIFLDIGNPAGSFLERRDLWNCADVVINCEDQTGAEPLSAFLCRNGGYLYFTRMRSNYTTAILVAESMHKNVNTIGMDQYFGSYNDFSRDLLVYSKPKLDKIDALYESTDYVHNISPATAGTLSMHKAIQVDDYIYASHVTDTLVDNALNISKYDCNVIIQGETGVGKEKILELIHKNSGRNEKPCVKVNCATIQETLAESEFFGYEAGAFTGAQSGGKIGYFELANNGILFLDEIGSLSLNMQSKLLRVLQENQFYRVGGTEQITVNVRVICANNVSLQKMVEEGRFREDLYYRLNICQINVPPLRDRKDDIDVLARHFLSHYNKKYGMMKEINPDGYAALYGYNWPGNVRELENIVHRLIINSRGNVISGLDVDAVLNQNVYDNNILDAKSALKREGHVNFDSIIEAQEKQLISYALESEGTTRKAADALGIPQAKLMRKKQKYGL